MNRVRPGAPSKATATTLCQKCLKRGHYSYECTTLQQDRPYVSRPSRTQQLLNPELAPKIQIPVAKSEEAKMLPVPSQSSTARVRGRTSGDATVTRRTRSRSTPSSWSSVSTVSTRDSRSRSPQPVHQALRSGRDHSNERENSHYGTRQDARYRKRSVDAAPSKHRHRSASPESSASSEGGMRSTETRRDHSRRDDRVQRSTSTMDVAPASSRSKPRSPSPYSRRATMGRGAARGR